MPSSLVYFRDDGFFIFSEKKGNITAMKNPKKYRPLYYMPPPDERNLSWVAKDRLDKAPSWCSVDLRDGNQALIVPMSLEEKIDYFKMLVDIGFKEIEVGFPAASETEFGFLRTLIDNDMIPDDVTIQVLTQSRPQIIERTFSAIKGASKVIVHLYNSTSFAQRQQVFRMDEDEIIKIAQDGATLFCDYANKMPETKFTFQYSPESFTGTELEFALRICNSVIDIWRPCAERPVIINLPATVETSMPHVYAQQIAFMSNNLNCREHIILSLHTHNDRGTGVAATELGLLAGAQRVEGTLFGNGERTGNVDIITLALNLYTHGANPKLNFSDMPSIVTAFEETNAMTVSPRHPYSGELVFAAFSGSHQDAIAKGIKYREENAKEKWTVPYLPIDPNDVGRTLETCTIRINSQSGKGGVGYVLERMGYNLPQKMREIVGYAVKDKSDKLNRELNANDVEQIFKENFVNVSSPVAYKFCKFSAEIVNGVKEYAVKFDIIVDGKEIKIEGTGTGRLDAIVNALTNHFKVTFADLHYSEHTLGTCSGAPAITYISTKINGKNCYGSGTDVDIIISSIKALVSALNKNLTQ